MLAGKKRAPESLGRVLVLGLGKSGHDAVDYLMAQLGGARDPAGRVRRAAQRRLRRLRAQGPRLRRHRGVRRGRGRSPGRVLRQGISSCASQARASPSSPSLYRSAAAVSDEVVSEVELAWRESDESSTWVAVTGTNGKTTVTALTNHLLRAAGMASVRRRQHRRHVHLRRGRRRRTDVYVAEALARISSHLRSCSRPNVAVLLNITPDHLHWHHTLENYAAAKMKVLDNLAQVPGSVAVMDASNDVVRAEVRRLRGYRRRAAVSPVVPMGTAEGLQGDMRARCGCRQRCVHQRRRRAHRGPQGARACPYQRR